MGNKILIIFLFIGIAFLSISPILADTFDKRLLKEDKNAEINDASMHTLQEAFRYRFTLEKNQKLIIELSCHSNDASFNLIIVGKGEYDSLDKIESKPSNFTTLLNFVYSEFAMGDDPENSNSQSNKIQIENDGYYYIEFMGDVTSNNYLISLPGEYYVIIYGKNTNPDKSIVNFNIKILSDGPNDLGDLIGLFFPIIGICLIGYVVAVSFKRRIKMWRES